MLHISQLMALDSITDNKNKTVTKEEYELFCKEFIFNELKDQKFGDVFCERFGFNNIVLRGMSNEESRYLIQKLGYVK